MDSPQCPVCHVNLQSTFYFCPNCGKKIKEPPPSTTIGKQLSIYAFSIFVPPFGLVPGFKYLFQKDNKAKLIGMTALILTLLSTLLTVWITARFVNQINSTLNSQLQLNGY